MNNNFDYNPINKNHYADFDEHGNPLTGNRNSLSRYTPDRGFGMNRGSEENDEPRRSRNSNAAHAYGDMSRGTRYGEGGSRQGGGSSYGHSNYGLSGNKGPRFTQHDRSRDESRQYNAYGDSNHYDTRNHRLSNSFGRSSDGGYIHDDRNRGYPNQGHYDDSYQGGRYRNSGQQDAGYDRERYNRQNMSQNRIDYSNRGYIDEGWRSRQENERYDNRFNNERDRFNRNRGW
ncbi:hypothetical protein ACFSRY_00320 [Pontibacter locisalis]|uniref:Uncharacterized protein n=1 Tax=Pontibacter locisalis TaxID=1719035 RepID=A0ABW5IH21_9BACT